MQAELELQHLRWPRRSVAQVGPAAFAALSRSLVAGTVQGMCVCPSPPSAALPYGAVEAGGGLGLRPGASTGGGEGGSGCGGGVGQVGDSFHRARAPFVTPVLMVLFDNGSVQCYTSPAHVSAVEKERARAMEQAAATVAAAKAAKAGITSGVAEGHPAAQVLTTTPCSPPPTTRGHRQRVEGEGEEEETDWPSSAAAASAISTMDKADRLLLRSRTTASPETSVTRVSAAIAAVQAREQAEARVSDASRSAEGASSHEPSSHRALTRPRLWPPPPATASTLKTLKEALAARRAADRAQRLAWASYATSGTSGGDGDVQTQVQAAALPRYSSLRRGGVVADSVLAGRGGRGGGEEAGGGAGGGGSSSGHDSTSDDDAMVSFRPQVRAPGGGLRGDGVLCRRLSRLWLDCCVLEGLEDAVPY